MMATAPAVKSAQETKKRQRDIDISILNSFWDLAEVSDDKRIEGSELILTKLRAKQLNTQAGSERCKELDYILKRLIRGLASSRQCARHGFSTLLTCILKQYRLYTVTELLKLVNDNLKVVKSESKSEITGILFGRILAFLSIIQSELVKEASSSEVHNLVKALLALRRRKKILRPVCSTGLAQLMPLVDKSTFTEQIWPQIELELNGGWSESDPDTLLLLLSVIRAKHVGKELLTEHWDCKKLLCKDNIQHFSDIIVKSSTVYQVCHPVCEELALAALEKNDSFFSHFWEKVICDRVLDVNSSNRKLLCINLAARVFDLLSTVDQVKAVLSPKFLSCIIHQTSVKHDKTRDAIQQLLAAIVNFVSKSSNSEAQLTVLTSLVSPPSTVLFDSVTRSKTVSSVISKMNADACRLLANYLINLIRGKDVPVPPNEEGMITIDASRDWAIRTLSSLVTHSALANDDEWQLNIIQFIFASAFFEIKKPVPSVLHCEKRFFLSLPEKLRHSFREAFTRSLNKLATFHPDKEKASHHHQTFVDLLYKLAVYAQTLIDFKNPEVLAPLPPFDETARQSWSEMMTTVKKVRSKSKEGEIDGDCRMAFQLLFLYSGFQLFFEPSSTSEVLQELQVCFDKVCQKKRRSKSGVADDELLWVDVLVDLLMSLLSIEQQLTRTVVNIAIMSLTPHMTSKSLLLITDVLKPNLTADGVIGFDDDDDDDEDVSSMEEEEMDAEDSEKYNALNGDTKSSDISEDETNPDDSSDDDDDEDAEDTVMDVDEEMRANVKTALGDAAADSDNEASDFDDDAMFRIDDMLSAAFKSLRKGKRLDKEKELKLKHYKMRCIDLLEQFVKHTTSASKLVMLITPLLDAAVLGWHQKESELGSRACRVITEINTSKKQLQYEDLTMDMLENLLSNLVQQASKVTSLGVQPSKLIASSFIFVLRVCMELETVQSVTGLTSDSKTSPGLLKTLELLKSQVDDFCSKRTSSVNHVFMQQLLEKRPDLMWPLLETIMKYATSAEVRVFCRTQVCMWLAAVISRKLVQDMEVEKWKSFKNKVVPELLKIVLKTEADQIKPLYLTQVLNVLQRIVSADGQADNFLDEKVQAEMTERLMMLRKLSKDLRTPCNRIAGLFKCRLQPVTQRDKKADRLLRKEKRKLKQEAMKSKLKLRQAETGAAKKFKRSKSDSTTEPAAKKAKLAKPVATVNGMAKKANGVAKKAKLSKQETGATAVSSSKTKTQ